MKNAQSQQNKNLQTASKYASKIYMTENRKKGTEVQNPNIQIRRNGADITYDNGCKIVFGYTKETKDYSDALDLINLDILYMSRTTYFLNVQLFEDDSKTMDKKIVVANKYESDGDVSNYFQDNGSVNLKENLRQYFLEHYYPSKEERRAFWQRNPQIAITVRAAFDVRNRIIENENFFMAQKTKDDAHK